jgi:ABC-2 type transport system permease protein
MTSAAPSPAHPERARRVPAGTAVALAYGVVLRQVASTGRIVGLTLLSLVAPLSGWALGSGSPRLSDGVNLVASVGLGLVLPIVALVFGGAALGDLREDKTLVYLWLRPMDRWPIVVGAALAAATLTAPIVFVSIVLAAVLTGVGSGLVGASVLAVAVGLVVYVCLFTFLGVWLKRSIVWGLAYILIWEGFVAQAGPGVARVAMRSYTRSILVEGTGVDLNQADYSFPVAVIVPLVVAAGALALASWRLSRQDID